MKKFRNFLILVLVFFFLVACNKKDGKVIEVNSSAILDALVENRNIVFCTINFRSEQGEDFYRSLEKVSKKAGIDIYYIDSEYLSGENVLLLGDVYAVDYYNNTYHVFLDGQFVVDKEYSTYEDLFRDLNGKDYNSEIESKSEEEIKTVLRKAEEHYEQGEMSLAKDLVASIWPAKEAKDFIEQHPYLHLVNEWENYELLSDGKARYTGLYIYSFSNVLYLASSESVLDGFEMPNIEEYEKFYYKVSEGDLLISQDGKKYSKYAVIDYLDPEQLVLEISKKKLTFLRVS